MSITTIALLPLMAYILSLRLKSVYLILKKNEVGKKKSEILYLALSVILIVFLLVLSELIMP